MGKISPNNALTPAANDRRRGNKRVINPCGNNSSKVPEMSAPRAINGSASKKMLTKMTRNRSTGFSTTVGIAPD
jgi:hypothetical protein